MEIRQFYRTFQTLIYFPVSSIPAPDQVKQVFMKYIFVPISIVGCGKSTVFRTLTTLSNRFVHIENDYFSGKKGFYETLGKLVDGCAPYILVDRNNHLKVHRQQILENFKSEEVRFVALIFVPVNINKKRLFDTNWNKIQSRGDNHPQVKSGSATGQAKMILNSFIKNFDPYNPKAPYDSQFDYALAMKYGPETSRENVDIILEFVKKLESTALLSGSLNSSMEGSNKAEITEFSPEAVNLAFKNSMQFKVTVTENIRNFDKSQRKRIEKINGVKADLAEPARKKINESED